MLCSRILKPIHGTGSGWAARSFDAFFDGLDRLYEWSLRYALRRRGLVLASAVLAVAATVVIFRLLPRELVPTEDRGTAFGIVIAPEGATLDYTDRYMRQVEARLMAVPERQALFTATGLGFGGPGRVTNGFVFLNLKPRAERERSQQEIVARALPAAPRHPGRARLPGQPAEPRRTFSSSEIEYVLQADSYEELQQATQHHDGEGARARLPHQPGLRPAPQQAAARHLDRPRARLGARACRWPTSAPRSRRSSAGVWSPISSAATSSTT